MVVLTLALASALPLQAQTTYSWTSPTAGGTWSTSTNWGVTSGSGSTFPGSADTAVLGNVTSGTRVVTYNSSATGTVGTLTLDQTSAATNELALATNLIVTNNFTLGATGGGTSLIYLSTSGLTLKMGTGSGTLTVGSGGTLDIAAVTNTASTVSGNVILNGGSLSVERGQVTSSVNNTISGSLTMNSGTLTLASAVLGGGTGMSPDNRLTIGGNLTINGGTVTEGTSSTLYLNGATNDISGATSFNSGLSFAFNSSSAQSLNLGANSVGSLILRGGTAGQTTIKTVSSTGSTIAGVTFFQTNATGNMELLLGGNLTTTGTAATTISAANFSQGASMGLIIDTGTSTGYNLNATSMIGGFVPNNGTGGATSPSTTEWTLQGNGTIKALSFDTSQNNNGTAISGNVTLNASGGNSTANVLSNNVSSTANPTIAATSSFIYSGSAVTGTPATLTSTRTIGALGVTGTGFLNIAQASLSTGGGVMISNGGLQLNGASAGTLTLALNQNFTMTGGTLNFDLGTAQDLISGSGTGTFSLTNATLALNLGSGFNYDTIYSVISGFAAGSMSNLAITGYDTTDYFASLASNGDLTFEVISVPEPGTFSFLLLGVGGLFLILANRRQTRLL